MVGRFGCLSLPMQIASDICCLYDVRHFWCLLLPMFAALLTLLAFDFCPFRWLSLLMIVGSFVCYFWCFLLLVLVSSFVFCFWCWLFLRFVGFNFCCFLCLSPPILFARENTACKHQKTTDKSSKFCRETREIFARQRANRPFRLLKRKLERYFTQFYKFCHVA